MVNAENDEGCAIGEGLAVLARAARSCVLVSGNDVLGAEVARTQAVGAGDNLRHLGTIERREALRSAVAGIEVRPLQGLVQRGADIAAQRIVAGHAFVGALEDDDVLLAFEGLDDGRFGEGPNHIDVNRADRCSTSLAHVVHGGFDIFGSRAQRDKDGLGIVALVLREQPVVAAGQIAELLVCSFEHFEDWLDEVIAPSHDALHVVFLILHRAEQQRIGEIDHRRNATALGPEERALRLGGRIDDVLRRAQVFANQVRLVLIEGALQVRGQEAVHDIHARRQAQLCHAAQDQGLVGGLLRVLAHDHDPAGIERAIDVVMAAMDVQRMLGQRAGAHFQHHGRAFPRRVIILFHAIHNALA